jgi:DNA polymerase-4
MVPPNYTLYKNSSDAFFAILEQYTPDVERYSIDEAYMDMTGTRLLLGDPIEVAHRIKDRIHRELGFTVNVGVSCNKLLAKMASDFQKPDRVHTLFLDEIERKMWPLPVSDLFFVGRATTKKLFNFGIKTIGELAKADVKFLKLHLKKHGEVVWNFANGRDMEHVESTAPPNKGYGNSTTVPFDVTDDETAKKVLLALSETVASRLRKDGVKAEVLSVGIKDYEFHYSSHQMVLSNATNITNEIHKYSCQLFDESWDGRPIRHLGIHTSRIRDNVDSRQMSLFDTTDYSKFEVMDETVDLIRGRFGTDLIKRAVFVNGKIDHLEGGVSREKRNVEYEKLKID